SRVALRSIFFDVNQAVLKPESKAELWVLIAFLKTNPNVEIEIGGHTDNVGDKAANITLSENRAKAVYQFLITEGNIASSRLKYKGYGEQKPLVLNDNDSHRAENRRTEFKITKSK
ncbi:MAG: OmpA family protein, partial [Bacteroidia bacterium]